MKKNSEYKKKKAIKRYLDGEKVKQIAEAMKISTSTIYSWIRQYNEKRNSIVNEVTELKKLAERQQQMIEILKTVDCTVSAPLKEKLSAMEKLYGKYNNHLLCETMEVDRGTFLYHIKRSKGENNWYNQRREELKVHIQKLFEENNQIYGSKKITALLRKQYVIHYHVRSEGQIIKKAVYIAIGVNMDGRKDVLGMWVGENESAKFWAGVLNSLRNRGVEDILIACTDNLTGFSQAIEAVFPKTDIQNCIIHQLRNSSKYVSYKDIKSLMADLKKVYTAATEEAALDALDSFAAAWDSKYPKISKSWYENWPNLSTYFKFPQELRKLIYTTNTIEGFNRQLKKVTKAKSVFPTDDSLFKMLYLAMKDITKKWTGRRQDWSRIYAQLVIYYGDRIPE